MSDNLRRYRAIKTAIMQLYPTEPRGNTARHLHTLAALVSGIVGSRSTNLPAIAGKVPDRGQTILPLDEKRADKRSGLLPALC